jgi:hypothetical protein
MGRVESGFRSDGRTPSLRISCIIIFDEDVPPGGINPIHDPPQEQRMNITFSGRVTQKDLEHIYRLGTPQKAWFTVFSVVMLILVSIITIYTAITDIFTPGMLMPLFIFVYLATYPLWIPLSAARKAYRSQPAFREEISGSITEESIQIKLSNAESTSGWGYFTSVKRSPDMVLLDQGHNVFNFFPRSFFASDADWNTFLAFLNEKILRGELKEKKGDLILPQHPTWRKVILILGIGAPIACFIIALIVMLVYNFHEGYNGGAYF